MNPKDCAFVERNRMHRTPMDAARTSTKGETCFPHFVRILQTEWTVDSGQWTTIVLRVQESYGIEQKGFARRALVGSLSTWYKQQSYWKLENVQEESGNAACLSPSTNMQIWPYEYGVSEWILSVESLFTWHKMYIWAEEKPRRIKVYMHENFSLKFKSSATLL